LVVRN